MNTQDAINKYNSALFAADGATAVKIGKTVYQIMEINPAGESESSCIVIKKANTVKDLIPDTYGSWFLWSGRGGKRRGLPKNVTPEFI